MTPEQTFIRSLAIAERKLATTIAARALEHPDPQSVKYLRTMWQIANARADYFEEFAANG